MRPTQNMFATQEDWQEALARWMSETPSLTNGKVFMVFEGAEVSPENFMFEGDLVDFADCYFSANDWEEVVAFAQDSVYTLIVEDDPRWDDIDVMHDLSEIDDDMDDQHEELTGRRPRMSFDEFSEWGTRK